MPKPTQEDSSFKRKLSKREKKELKKQEKKEQKVKDGKADESMADKLYTGKTDCLCVHIQYFQSYSQESLRYFISLGYCQQRIIVHVMSKLFLIQLKNALCIFGSIDLSFPE